MGHDQSRVSPEAPLTITEVDRGVDQSVVTLVGVGVVFGDRRTGRVEALSDITLRIQPREFVAIVGPSGCGKSTLLKLIGGLISPSSGIVRLNGHDIRGPSPQVGLMFQQPVLLDWKSAIDNVLLPTRILKLDKKSSQLRAAELLEDVGLGEFVSRYPRDLSGGMQQRVALCRALIHDPPVLLLDEPFGALDAMTREQLNNLLQHMCLRAEKTTVLVTHDIDEAVYLADRVVVISRRPGRVLEDREVRLPRPRVYSMRSSKEFRDCAEKVRGSLGLI